MTKRERTYLQRRRGKRAIYNIDMSHVRHMTMEEALFHLNNTPMTLFCSLPPHGMNIVVPEVMPYEFDLGKYTPTKE